MGKILQRRRRRLLYEREPLWCRALGLPARPSDDEVGDLIRALPPHFATSYAFSGSLDLNVQANDALSGDQTGSVVAAFLAAITFSPSGGTAPTISGFLNGTGTAAAGNILIAHATDPLQSQGDAAYSPGFTVAGSKVKLFIMQNLDTTNTITIINGAMAGTTLFDGTASHGTLLEPGGIYIDYDPAGIKSGALTTTSNDKMTLSVGAGSPTYQLVIFYGP